MRAPAGLLLSLLILSGPLLACQQNDQLLPKEPARRQKSLSERILDRGLRPDPDPPAQEDAALALAEVVITQEAPKLRLIVASGLPTLAVGAARALVRIRVLREPDRKKALDECAKFETNAFVQAECARQLPGESAPPTSKPMSVVIALLESDDAEQRRSGLRHLLRSSMAAEGSARLESALYHRLEDPDARARLLAQAVLLRRSLVANPFAIEDGSR